MSEFVHETGRGWVLKHYSVPRPPDANTIYLSANAPEGANFIFLDQRSGRVRYWLNRFRHQAASRRRFQRKDKP